MLSCYGSTVYSSHHCKNHFSSFLKWLGYWVSYPIKVICLLRDHSRIHLHHSWLFGTLIYARIPLSTPEVHSEAISKVHIKVLKHSFCTCCWETDELFTEAAWSEVSWDTCGKSPSEGCLSEISTQAPQLLTCKKGACQKFCMYNESWFIFRNFTFIYIFTKSFKMSLRGPHGRTLYSVFDVSCVWTILSAWGHFLRWIYQVRIWELYL